MASFLRISQRIFVILMMLAIFFVIYNLFEAYKVKKDASVNVSLINLAYNLSEMKQHLSIMRYVSNLGEQNENTMKLYLESRHNFFLNLYEAQIIFRALNMQDEDWKLIKDDFKSLMKASKSIPIKPTYDFSFDDVSNYVDDLRQNILVYHEKLIDSTKFLETSSAILAIVLFTIFIGGFGWMSVENIHIMSRISKSVENTRKFVLQETESLELPKYSWLEEEKLQNLLKNMTSELQIERLAVSAIDVGTLEDVIPVIFARFRDYIPYDRIGVAFINPDGTIRAETGVIDYGRILLAPGFTLHVNETTLGQLIENPKVRIINDLEKHYRTVHKSEATRLLLEEGIRSNLTVPLCTDGRCIGFMFFSSLRKNAFSEIHASRAQRIGKALLAILKSSYVTQELVVQTTRSFIEIVGKKDFETGNHLVRVSQYSRILAERLAEFRKDVTPKFIREIEWFAPLHDIGKVGIPDRILLKPGKLTNEEFEIMKKHVIIGEEIIKTLDKKLYEVSGRKFFSLAVDIISGHHERWDGKGYPRGLKGEEIPLAGRIVAVADVFDALSTKRPYKEPLSFEDSVEIIRKNSGSHFDPYVVEAFLSEINRIRKVYERYKD